MKRGRALVASVTCLAFTTLVVWPRGAAAQGGSQPAPPPADAPPPGAPPPAPDATMAQAKQHFEAGRNAYNAGDYVNAIREFKAAEQLRPSPILDYNIGLANEKLGKRRVAVKYYKRYLELQPNAANRAEVEGKVAQLEQEIAALPPPAAQAQPGGTAVAPPPEQPGDMPPPSTGMPPAQPGYDPYAQQQQPPPPPIQPVVVKKKRSLWWIGLIIAGAVTITIAIAVVAYVYTYNAVTTTTPAAHALTAGALSAMPLPPSRLERNDVRNDFHGIEVLRF